MEAESAVPPAEAGGRRVAERPAVGLQSRLAPAVGSEKQPGFSRLFPASPVLHENQLTHTDLKPENILFVNSEFETLYNEHKVGVGRGQGRALW